MDAQEAVLFFNLKKKCSGLAAEKEALRKDLEQTSQEKNDLSKEVTFLREQLEWFKRNFFGKKSERVVRDFSAIEQQLYFPGFEPIDVKKEEEKQVVPEHKRKKRKSTGKDKIFIPDNLPVKEVTLDLSDEQKICQETGLPLVKIKEDVTSKLAHTPESYYIIKIIRPIYGLPNGEGILAADTKNGLLSKCQADESFLAEIVTKKFADHIPLNRMAEIFQRVYLGVSTQLLSQWVIKSGNALKQLHELMRKRILKEKLIFVDESPISVQMKGKGKVHQGYMWVMVGGGTKDPPYRYFDFSMNRKHENIDRLVEDYNGILHSDKYGAYETLANRKQIVWCPCWSHIRRKFVEVEEANEFCIWVIGEIRRLFMLEREAFECDEDERQRIREEKEIPIIDELIVKVKEKLEKGPILPKSKYKEALGYFCGLIPYLKNYTKHPFSRLDNNIAERTIRSLALGRKNWLFVGSESGGEAAAVLLSLAQSCRAVGINPREYFEDVMRRINSHTFSRLEELLPDKWSKSDLPKNI